MNTFRKYTRSKFTLSRQLRKVIRQDKCDFANTEHGRLWQCLHRRKLFDSSGGSVSYRWHCETVTRYHPQVVRCGRCRLLGQSACAATRRLFSWMMINTKSISTKDLSWQLSCLDRQDRRQREERCLCLGVRWGKEMAWFGDGRGWQDKRGWSRRLGTGDSGCRVRGQRCQAVTEPIQTQPSV